MGRLPSAESRIITLSPELINLLPDFTQDMTPDERQSRCATIPGQSQMANLNTKRWGKLEIQKEKYILFEDICDGVRSEVYYACNRYQHIYRFL